MFTHSRIKVLFAAIFAVAVAFTCESALAQDEYVQPESEAVNPYGGLKRSELLDAIDRDHPADTSETINDPRLLDSMVKGTDLVDQVDNLYPADTSGARQDTRYQLDPDTMNSVDIVDTIDRLDAGKPIP